jgi:hypothetical protein
MLGTEGKGNESMSDRPATNDRIQKPERLALLRTALRLLIRETCHVLPSTCGMPTVAKKITGYRYGSPMGQGMVIAMEDLLSSGTMRDRTA